ncbi:sensor histidine kinase [Sphingomonas montana]|uniref:sensor histidine kinase n=1 Tax=Sphingomonas montana TaxID=1843236 RepID=UPI00096FFE29|nr:HAMP domain-containing sensor histidine kinase [Sphingomonas montana]
MMAGGPSMRTPIHGLVDREERLASADLPLATLNVRAGGRTGGKLVVPQLAGLVRLVRRLGVVVSRGVTIADGDRDLDLWVRAAPEGDAVALAIVGWTETQSRQPFAGPDGERMRDFGRGAADWRWTVDAHLRLTRLDPPQDGAVGQPLARTFVLRAGADGTVPMIEAMAAGNAFGDQLAHPAGDPARTLRLSGQPLAATDGSFAGFEGVAGFVDEDDGDPPIPADGDTGFGPRLGAALRAPIDRIITQADAIRGADAELQPDYVEYAGDIANAGRHLLDLVDDLVDLQAIESMEFRARSEAIDLADIARRAAGLLAVRAERSGVRIDAPGPDDLLPARGEFGRGLQILVNLIGNAVRYSPPGGTIWIRGERDAHAARIVVADQGKGIAAEDQDRVFDKFERVDPTEPGGTGLGLYISRRLARAMGGDILLDSEPGDGARFILVLPTE